MGVDPRPRSPGRRSLSWSARLVCFPPSADAPWCGGGLRWLLPACVHSSPAGRAGRAGPSFQPTGF